MKKYYGYAGKILRVNLTDKKITKEIISDETARKYIGGNGFGVKYLYDEVPAKIDPLGVENKLFIMTGPTEGTVVPGAGRACIITKSPLNNRFIDSYFGGHFGGEIKFAGYDGIIIEGKSATPVYLVINDDDVKIEEASSIWGMTTIDAQKEVKKVVGEEYATLAIGIAGENLVPMACIISGVNAAGRGGTGAVMGSKNLKLIAVKGTNGVKVADIEGLNAYSLDVINRMKAHPGMGRNLPAYGTTGSPKTNNDLGIFGTRNWQQEQFEDAGIISGPYFKDKLGYGDGSNTCLACPIACSQITKVKSGKFKDAITIGPEYETLFSLGSICGNGNIDYIVKGDQFCDELGIDTISAGVTIAFAMECFEKGILTLDDTEGIDLRFGNGDAIITLLEKIAKKEGLGKILAYGTRKASEIIGKGSEDFAIHVKGLEVPAHSSRGLPGMAIGYATSNRGGSHQDGRATAERTGKIDRDVIVGKGKYNVEVQRMTTYCDCMILCRMTENAYGLWGITEDHINMLKLITGMDVTKEELVDAADRVYALERAFNIREGIESRETDVLPKRFMEEPIPEGPSKGKVITREILDLLLDEYYEERGWDKVTGYPTKETLKRLNLEYVINDLYEGS